MAKTASKEPNILVVDDERLIRRTLPEARTRLATTLAGKVV